MYSDRSSTIGTVSNCARSIRRRKKYFSQFVLLRAAKLPSLTLAMLLLSGCGPNHFALIGPVSPNDNSATGNWQITAKTTSGKQPFSALAGSVVQGSAQSNGTTPLFAILQSINPDSCFLGITTVPLQGSLTGSSVSLVSLSDSGQYVNISGTSGSTIDTFTGKLLINDGCANGVEGTLSGIKIPPLTGTFSGPWTITSASGLGLTLTQDSFADGYGLFHLQGTASFSGINCFTTGTLQGVQSTIDGQQVQLTIATNESSSSTVTMTGTLDPLATMLTLTSIQVVSGRCSGPAGTASLSL